MVESTQDERTLEELTKRTGVSRRNIKYWTALYDLPFRREGRRNLYPEITERLLRAIAALSAHPIFTTAYVRWMIDTALEREPADPRRAAALATRWADVMNAFSAGGLLPPGLTTLFSRLPPSQPTANEVIRPRVSPSSSGGTHKRQEDDALL